MRVLAMDTATALGAVAVTVNGELRAELCARVSARHGETLLPQIERALELAGIGAEELDLVAVGVGPGTFTGTRVALATAKGLSLSLGVPLVGISTLTTIAAGLLPSPGHSPDHSPDTGSGGGIAAPLLDAYKGELFFALYGAPETEGGTPRLLAPAAHAPPEEAGAALRELAGEAPIRLAGGGLRKHKERLLAALGEPCSLASAAFDLPRGALLAALGERRFKEHGPDDAASLVPLYVRDADAKLPSTTNSVRNRSTKTKEIRRS